MEDTVRLKFISKRYGRTSYPTFTVARDAWDSSVTSWLWPAMKRYEKELSLAPVNVTNWDSLKFALPGLAMVLSWRSFTTHPVADLEVEDVRDLFMDIDDTFHSEWGYDRGALRSTAARKFVLSHLLELRPDGTLQRVKGIFLPKGRAIHQPRPLISDQVLRQSGEPIQPPIGAMPHVNPKELKEKTKQRLVADLDRIALACSQELDAYFVACERLHAIREAPIDVVAERSAIQKLDTRRLKTVVEIVAELSPEERRALTAYYLRLDNRQDASPLAPGYPGNSPLSADLCIRLGIANDRFVRAARYQYYPHLLVLCAAILLLQIATGWNVSSVLELTSRGVRALPGRDQYLIQSIKSKTRDDTPAVLLEGADNTAVKALKFALGRLQALKDRQWADASETSLWLGPRNNHAKSKGLPISNLQKAIASLRQKYGLMHFTFEQIRVQKLTIVSLERGPIAAAEVAGHSNFASIGGYIDHIVTRRVNSSINLEFQRRWEAEVLSRIRCEPSDVPLVPIGDGSSCQNPAGPPDPAWLTAGVCGGQHCHDGQGCPNRTIVVDPDRIAETILTKEYYEKNWQRLYASNPHAFAAIHAPRIEFNACLHEYLRTGPYRHLING